MTDDPDGRLRGAPGRRMSVLPGGLGEVDDPQEEPLPAGMRPALTSISLRHERKRITAQASLALQGRVLTGSATRTDGDRERTIAAATLAALRPLFAEDAQIESAQVLDLAGRRVALTVVAFGGTDTEAHALAGCALVRGDVEAALARSVLGALNRRLDL